MTNTIPLTLILPFKIKILNRPRFKNFVKVGIPPPLDSAERGSLHVICPLRMSPRIYWYVTHCPVSLMLKYVLLGQNEFYEIGTAHD